MARLFCFFLLVFGIKEGSGLHSEIVGEEAIPDIFADCFPDQKCIKKKICTVSTPCDFPSEDCNCHAQRVFSAFEGYHKNCVAATRSLTSIQGPDSNILLTVGGNGPDRISAFFWRWREEKNKNLDSGLAKNDDRGRSIPFKNKSFYVVCVKGEFKCKPVCVAFWSKKKCIGKIPTFRIREKQLSWSGKNSEAELHHYTLDMEGRSDLCGSVSRSFEVSQNITTFSLSEFRGTWKICLSARKRFHDSKCEAKNCLTVDNLGKVSRSVEDLTPTSSEESVTLSWRIPPDWKYSCDIKMFRIFITNPTKEEFSIPYNACTEDKCVYSFEDPLQPNMEYTFKVDAFFSSSNKPSEFSTAEATPLPKCPKVLNLVASPDNGRLTWDTNEERPKNGSFLLTMEAQSFCGRVSYSHYLSATSYSLTNFRGEWSFFVQGVANRGSDHCNYTLTSTSANLGKVSEKVENLTATPREESVTLLWTIPSDWIYSCDISSFHISTRSIKGEVSYTMPYSDCTNDSCDYFLRHLESNTKHSFKVKAAFSNGAVSAPREVQTFTLLPPPDGSYTAFSKNQKDGGDIFLSYDFQRSGSKNITSCTIKIREIKSREEKTFDCLDKIGVIKNSQLREGRNYKATYEICNGRGCSSSEQGVTKWTPPEEPRFNGTIRSLFSNETHIEFHLPSVAGNHLMGSIYVLVTDGKHSLDESKMVLFVKNHLALTANDKRRGKRSLQNNRTIILTATLPLDARKYWLTKSKFPDNFTGEVFVCCVSMFESGNHYRTFKATKIEGPFFFEKMEVKTLGIYLSAGGMAIILLFIVGVLLCRRIKRKRHSKSDPQTLIADPPMTCSQLREPFLHETSSLQGSVMVFEQNFPSTPVHQTPLLLQSASNSAEHESTMSDMLTEEQIEALNQLDLLPEHHPIDEDQNSDPECDFNEYVNIGPILSFRESLDKFLIQSAHSPGIINEFRSIPYSNQNQTSNFGSSDSCKAKNRYRNNLPYDETRVVLPLLPDDPSSHYINANWVQIDLEEEEQSAWYIPTQGPLKREDTISDFWRMVWYNKVEAIVMLTNLEEKGKVKCDQYWPEAGTTMVFKDDISVSSEETVWKTYSVVRYFTVSRGQKTHKVVQYHYLEWPDHGVPQEVSPLAHLVEVIREEHRFGPTVVHCSAGIGRTGVLLLVLKCLEEVEATQSLNVKSSLQTLRNSRAALIQNAEQYRFSHYLLWVLLVERQETFPADDFHLRLKDGSLSEALGDQFKRLKTYAKDLTYETAMLPTIRHNYNRFIDVFPADERLVTLITIGDKIEDKYLNAVFVDGFNKKNAYIVTEHPTTVTMLRVWIMIVEQEIPFWILMNEADADDGQFPLLIPEKNSPLIFDCLTVKLIKKIQHDFFEENRVEIEADFATDQNFCFECVVIQFRGWMNGEISPITGAEGLLSLLCHLRESGPHLSPLLFTCSDGYTACGITLALDVACQRAEAFREVKIFGTCVLLSYSRPQFIVSQTQYEMLYEFMATYLSEIELQASESFEDT